MKHKVKVLVPVEKRGLFGFKSKVWKKRNIQVDGKTYREIQRMKRQQPYSLEEMVFYDELFHGK